MVRLTLPESLYWRPHILSTVEAIGESGLPERVLFVHAHPDDETIATGGTIATLLDRGAAVTVLTCTRGELGEVIPPELKHLEGAGAELGQHRTDELARAMRILGVDDQRFLGAVDARSAGRAPRRYLDSGMQWGADGAEPLTAIGPEALCAAGFDEVVVDIASVIAAVRPDAVVSYNDRGDYGHPDHIRASRASQRAAELMGVPFFAIEPAGSSAPVTLSVDVSAVLDRKTDALRAHRSQVTVDGGRYALSSGPSLPIATEETFRRVRPEFSVPLSWSDQPIGVKVLSCLATVLAGIVVGTLTTVNHQVSVLWFGVRVGLGIVAALAVVAALLVGLRLFFDTRLMPGFAVLGILAAIGALSFMSAGGSVLVPANTAGWLWTFGPSVIALIVLGWPRTRPVVRARLRNRPESKGNTSP